MLRLHRVPAPLHRRELLAHPRDGSLAPQLVALQQHATAAHGTRIAAQRDCARVIEAVKHATARHRRLLLFIALFLIMRLRHGVKNPPRAAIVDAVEEKVWRHCGHRPVRGCRRSLGYSSDALRHAIYHTSHVISVTVNGNVADISLRMAKRPAMCPTQTL